MKYISFCFVMISFVGYSQEWDIKRDSIWNKYRNEYFIDWNTTSFVTQSNVDSTSQVYLRIFDKVKDISCEKDNDKIKDILYSGLSYPIEINVNAGDVFYKIVPRHFDDSKFAKNQSVYYLDAVEYSYISNHNEYLESYLGLPLGSVSVDYKVYRITAQKKTTVYKSYIAPTIQYLKDISSVLYRTKGGVVQTLVLNVCDSAIWKKVADDTIQIAPKALPKY
ncbi:hypothetical protein [Myroides odoratus]|uniref:hypothetical protein n=1 Tax=Myroides odoratus TaxID=256 RepID=UPI003340DE2D